MLLLCCVIAILMTLSSSVLCHESVLDSTHCFLVFFLVYKQNYFKGLIIKEEEECIISG